jgi:hypothetical protein
MDKRFSHQNLLEFGSLETQDLTFLSQFRSNYNRLGAAYQLIFIRLLNMLPKQKPFEVVDEIVMYAGLQLGLSSSLMSGYITNSKKISEHQNKILKYLDFNSFDSNLNSKLDAYIFEQAFQYEQLSLLLLKGNQFLRKHKSLIPTGNKFTELVRSQRRLAREAIFDSILSKLSANIITNIENLGTALTLVTLFS